MSNAIHYLPCDHDSKNWIFILLFLVAGSFQGPVTYDVLYFNLIKFDKIRKSLEEDQTFKRVKENVSSKYLSVNGSILYD